MRMRCLGYLRDEDTYLRRRWCVSRETRIRVSGYGDTYLGSRGYVSQGIRIRISRDEDTYLRRSGYISRETRICISKIRGYVSQGMRIPLSGVEDKYLRRRGYISQEMRIRISKKRGYVSWISKGRRDVSDLHCWWHLHALSLALWNIPFLIWDCRRLVLWSSRVLPIERKYLQIFGSYDLDFFLDFLLRSLV